MDATDSFELSRQPFSGRADLATDNEGGRSGNGA